MLGSHRMNQISIWVLLVSSFLLFQATKSVENDVRSSLIEFYQKLSNSNGPVNPGFGWNSSSDPCKDNWKGIFCDNHTHLVRKIHLDALNFTGVFHSHIICNTQSLASSISVISLHENRLSWANLEEISNCKQLTHLNIGRNLLSGSLPNSLAELNNLKFLDISWNYFWGDLPDLAQISGLQDFFAEKNLLTGPLPDFNFQNFLHFNVSFNKFTGSIPNGGGNLSADSFIGNPELCGAPLPNKCPSPKSKSFSTEQILIFFGYFLIGFAVLFIIIFKLCKRSKTKEEKVDSVNKIADDSFYMQPSMASSEYKMEPNKSEISESGVVSSSLIVLTSPEVNGLKFDELLRAPAELIGRGKHGTVYKVIREQGMTLAVKRIRDWSISSDDFKERMKRLDQVKHPNVLPAVAFYCSKQEKLLVYEYLQNGSLCGLLSGTRTGRNFEWSSRLGFAATITNTLAFMHKELCKDKIAHGNLKSSNILLNKNMEPCITEYGLMEINNEDKPSHPCTSDIYGLGVILLELLTGKLVQTNGMDLAKWVLSVVQEEWTVEVFDKSLIQEGASEERMVNLLQIAVKCVNRSPEARPSINQVVMMINNLKEEEERSIVSESC